MEGRGRSPGTMQGRKTNLSQHVLELCDSITLQEQARKLSRHRCEEKLCRQGELLPPLRQALAEDVRALRSAQKPKGALSCPRHKLTLSEACREPALGIALAGQTAEVAKEKLQAKIHDRANTCNMLLYQLRQRSQVRDELQRRLQQLQEAERMEKQHQAQKKEIRRLQNNIAKMRVKTQEAQKMTRLYLAERDALRKELANLPPHLDLMSHTAELYQGELEDMELLASDTLRAAAAAKADLAKAETRFLEDREWMQDSLAAQRRLQAQPLLKEARPKFNLDSLSLRSQDSVMAANLQAARAQREHRERVARTVERAKTVTQSSHIWEIPSRLLEWEQSTVYLQKYIKELKEKKQALKETLKELELKRDSMKFQPPNRIRCRPLEEELRLKWQQEEARLEHMRAQTKKNMELLLEVENGVDDLQFRLRGVTVPGQDDSAQAMGLVEKLQACGQKLQYLAQHVANLPPDSYSRDEDNETFVKVREVLEERAAKDPNNLKVSLEGSGGSARDSSHLDDCDERVPTRADIKKQGLLLVQRRKRRGYY
ncbi:coiled-coil domain-containing protein 183-like [Colius striatus]|uniref:coiled-coil domain-containing protein 183-like n=1 Tax=Colius striatus TaxID=57412 RepID=UPI002B1E33A4|nr:coiled-coil domain-containing protein 183-like [Colius striatus]